MAFLFSGAWLSGKFNQKLLLAIIYTLPNIIGTVVFLSESDHARHISSVGS